MSITFLTFAIFYDELIDDDNENAEEYWHRIENEIKQAQNSSRAQILNKTIDPNYVSILNGPKFTGLKPSITFENYTSGAFEPNSFYGKWISSNQLLHFDQKLNLIVTNVTDMSQTVLIDSKLIVSSIKIS